MIKHLLVIFFIAITLSFPDLASIGETIKNEAVKVQQTVQKFAKQEVQIAEEKINEGLEKIKGETHQNAPQIEQKQAQKPSTPILIAEAPINIPQQTIKVEEPAVAPAPIRLPAIQAEEIKPEIEDNKEHKQKPQKMKEDKLKQKKGKDHKKGERPPPPHPREQSSDQSQDDIEIKREQRHKQEKGKGKKQHQIKPEELKKKMEQREKRIKEKEEKMKRYEQKHSKRQENGKDKRQKDLERQKPEHYKKEKINKENSHVKLSIEDPKIISNLQVNLP